MSILIGFIFVIGILVLIHEFGHFLVAKRSGVRVEKFSLGFGKKLFGFRRGETQYQLCALPLGGFVKMFGEGGEGSFIVEEITADSPAHKAGFTDGDKIIEIEGYDLTSIPSGKELEGKLKSKPGAEFKFIIEREDKQFEIKAGPDALEGSTVYSESEYPRSFSKQSILSRLGIIVAGPFMNLVFPFVLMPIVFMIGIAVPAYLEKSPTIEYVAKDSAAEKAGFMPGDSISQINDKHVDTWRDVRFAFAENLGSLVVVKVDRGGVSKSISMKAPTTPGGIEDAGIALPLKAVVGKLMTDAPAQKAGVKVGDRIVEINGQPVANWYQMASIISKRPDQEITLLIQRDTEKISIKMKPMLIGESGRGIIGIEPLAEVTLKKYGFLDSIVEGIKTAGQLVVDITNLLLKFVYKLVTGQLSMSAAKSTIGGPIAIAQMSGAALQSGISTLLQFTVYISISLGLINLFPIPVLDGGHVVYLTLEAIRRRPLSIKTLEITQRIGFVFLIMLMLLAVYNDINRLNVFEKLKGLFN